MSREERHQQLLQLLTEDPLQTDESLAQRLGVSVPTVRLDRMTLGVPALRRRSQQLAQRQLRNTEPSDMSFMPGELIFIERGTVVRAQLLVPRDMAAGIGGAIPTYSLLAHAERLVGQVVSGQVVLTAVVNVKCYRPIRGGELLLSEARVLRHHRGRIVVLVQMTADHILVFRGKYAVNVMESTMVGST